MIALTFLSAVAGLFWRPLLLGAAGTLATFLWTTFSFVRWAWTRDQAVALTWPGVTFLRGLFQGAGLAIGLVYSLLKKHRSPEVVAGQRSRMEL